MAILVPIILFTALALFNIFMGGIAIDSMAKN